MLPTMPRRGEVLVAIVNSVRDMEIARDDHWYRIPVETVEQRLSRYWAPQWLAFYQPKVFGSEAFAIHYYAQVVRIQQVYRWQLFPNEAENPKTHKQYYKLTLTDLEELPQPIVSRQQRRISFIPTNLVKLTTALDVQELY